MTSEDLEDWDDSFLEELIQVEELALSSAAQNKNPLISCYLPPLPPPPRPYFPPPPAPPPRSDVLSYSPPRELSQRTVDHREFYSNGGRIDFAAPTAPSYWPTAASDSAKDVEIQHLKKELGRVSKQLAELEHECLELKKERNKEPIKIVDSRSEAQILKHRSSKMEMIEHGFSGMAHQAIPQEFPNKKSLESLAVHRDKLSSKDVGVQKDLPTHLALSGKLGSIWGGSSDHTLGRNLILKLLAVCPTDFRVLFGFMEINSSSKKIDPHSVESLRDAVPQPYNHFHASEAEKLSHLHCVVTKISSGMMQVQALVEALLDLSKVQNVVIVHRSLHILRVLLKHLSGFERKTKGRENVVVKGLRATCSIEDLCGAGSRQTISSDGDKNEPPCADHTLSGLGCCNEALRTGDRHTFTVMSSSFINWFSLFEQMCQITKSNEECLRMEAVSIMNIVVMGSDAYTEREKFCSIMVLEILSQVLRKGAGIHLQKEAVILLYLLLNCPKILDSFCSGLKNWESFGPTNDKQGSSASEYFPLILEGLADCITCCGNGLQELDLRRSTIILLAFLASSSKSGFEILVGHKLYREANFLAVIMQLLVLEIDAEATVSTRSGDIFRARTLLIREVLILLNRLVSSPAYSTSVLRALTNSRDMASLTIDIANRLSHSDQKARGSDDMVRTMRESEIVDLGRVFKKRVHAFLGDNRG